MNETESTRSGTVPGPWRSKMVPVIAAMLVPGACVNVTAPDKPIVINLNISITQEVVYRLDSQAKTLIQSNPGIF